MGDEEYVRKRRYRRYRAPGHGVEFHEALSGPDAPYGPRDARFWWAVVAVMVVLIVAAAVAVSVFG